MRKRRRVSIRWSFLFEDRSRLVGFAANRNGRQAFLGGKFRGDLRERIGVLWTGSRFDRNLELRSGFRAGPRRFGWPAFLEQRGPFVREIDFVNLFRRRSFRLRNGHFGNLLNFGSRRRSGGSFR